MVTPIVALDAPAMADALRLVEALGETCDFYKVGSELFTAEGPRIVEALRARGSEVFLDLKFHDIPNTVRGAVRSAAALGVRLVTVHASGGRAMLEAAVAGAEDGTSSDARCKVLGVSVLTSMDGASVAEAWGRADLRVDDEVVRLATLARAAGLDGLVCSAHEAALVREAHGRGLELLVPGIRPAGAAADDQARTATPAAAARAGARYIILGRGVSRAQDPRAAMEAVVEELRSVER